MRPALKAMAAPPAAESSQLDALEAEALERPALPSPGPAQPTPEQLRLEDARALARQNPIAVANIVKTWVNGDAG